MPPRTTKTATAVTTEEQIQVQDTAEAAETTAPKRYIKVFTSPTCGPCKRYKPILLEEAEKRGVEVIQVELSDETKDQFMELGIRQVPVTIVFEADKEVSRLMGAPANIIPQMDSWGF
ncbi:thioredoxin family protein [Acinetobacter baumannii]|nr:thioredoxin family protein [Acinetobacter baumannii]